MRAVHFVGFLSAVHLLSGCASLKQQKRDTQQQVSTLSAFDGIYLNPFSKNNDAEFSSLWNQLILADKIDTLDFQKATIAFQAVGNNKIKATWLEHGIPKKSVVIKGKLKDNYFVSKHKRTIIPIPLIYGQIENNQFQLWLGADNRLHLERLKNGWGWVFLFLAGKDETRSYEYDKEIK
ncbi:hypothetical protein [Sphingobacterium multivorum]|uniref:hypothetical protein n=1 Tax=Sphingobacterium multivorum TaxID=28454 RepID=UPI000EDF5C7A|nr:hypothetical protein [Sphingobacterium multivorum]HAK29894.1 hypothetical protein [Sphingobacterium sp.]